MTGQSSKSAGRRPARHPQTVLVAAGRPADEPGQPLKVPIVLASNFRAGNQGQIAGREYSRDDAAPAWEALEEVIGELEGGDALAFASGMGAAAVLDLVPAGARVMAPTDCYAGVHALLADGQQQGRWHVDLGDDLASAFAQAGAQLPRAGTGSQLRSRGPATGKQKIRARHPAKGTSGETETGGDVGINVSTTGGTA